MNYHAIAVQFETQFCNIFKFDGRPYKRPFDADFIEAGTLYYCILNAFNKLNVSEEEISLFVEKYQNTEGHPLREISNIKQLQNDFQEIVFRYGCT